MASCHLISQFAALSSAMLLPPTHLHLCAQGFYLFSWSWRGAWEAEVATGALHPPPSFTILCTPYTPATFSHGVTERSVTIKDALGGNRGPGVFRFEQRRKWHSITWRDIPRTPHTSRCARTPFAHLIINCASFFGSPPDQHWDSLRAKPAQAKSAATWTTEAVWMFTIAWMYTLPAGLFMTPDCLIPVAARLIDIGIWTFSPSGWTLRASPCWTTRDAARIVRALATTPLFATWQAAAGRALTKPFNRLPSRFWCI